MQQYETQNVTMHAFHKAKRGFSTNILWDVLAQEFIYKYDIY